AGALRREARRRVARPARLDSLDGVRRLAHAAGEDRPAELGPTSAEVVVAPAEVALHDLVASDLDRGAPLEALVAIPVVRGRGDHPGQVDARRLEARDRLREVDEAVVRATGLVPERLDDGDCGADPSQHGSGVSDVPPDERSTEAQRDVARGPVGQLSGIGDLDGDQVLEPGLANAAACLLDEDGADVDTDNA